MLPSLKMSEIISLLQDNDSQAKTTSEIGTKGERLAQEYLLRRGFRLVCSNFKTPVGRNRKGVLINGEIDLIAYEDDCLCFIEVKTRSSDDFSAPISAVDLRKQRQIIRTAKKYRKTFHLEKAKFRYDAIGIVLNGKRAPKIEYFRGFFEEAKFQKGEWLD
jgi:putative endonuclease